VYYLVPIMCLWLSDCYRLAAICCLLNGKYVLGHNWNFAIFVAIRTAMIAKKAHIRYGMEHFHLPRHGLKYFAWPALMVFNSNYRRFAITSELNKSILKANKRLTFRKRKCTDITYLVIIKSYRSDSKLIQFHFRIHPSEQEST